MEACKWRWLVLKGLSELLEVMLSDAEGDVCIYGCTDA